MSGAVFVYYPLRMPGITFSYSAIWIDTKKPLDNFVFRKASSTFVFFLIKIMRKIDPTLRTRKLQRVALQREMAGLAYFLTELYRIEDMQYMEKERDRKLDSLIQNLLGGPDGLGWLQAVQNKTMDGILDRLRGDMPDIRREELLIFSYSAAGFNNTLSCHLAGLSCENAVSTMRSRLRNRIILLKTPYKAEYLALLPEKGCRIGEEMLYLHDLNQRKYGNSEKDQN